MMIKKRKKKRNVFTYKHSKKFIDSENIPGKKTSSHQLTNQKNKVSQTSLV